MYATSHAFYALTDIKLLLLTGGAWTGHMSRFINYAVASQL